MHSKSQEAIRLLLVDDHPVIVDGLTSMLAHESEVIIAGKCSTVKGVFAALAQFEIQIILLDVSLGTDSGIDACAEILKLYPDVKVIAFTIFDDPLTVDAMIHNGAHGYLLKNADKIEILKAINQVSKGGLWFKGKVAEILKGSGSSHKSTVKPAAPRISRREREVLRLVMNEFTNDEIAAQLFISPTTVVSHRKNLLRKMNVRNTAGLIRKAIRLEILN